MNVLYLQSMCSLLIVTFHPPQELSVVGGKMHAIDGFIWLLRLMYSKQGLFDVFGKM